MFKKMKTEDFKTIVRNEQLMEPILNQKPINLNWLRNKKIIDNL